MRRTRVTLGLAALAAGAAVLVAAVAGSGTSARGRASGSFAWLHPSAPPTGWNVARTTGGSTFAYPPSWRPIKTDPGTASAALVRSRGRLDGYLNATPKQGMETLAGWSRFRPKHNLGEGDRGVRVIASSTGLTFRAGHGSCVIDAYRTSRTAYREIACLVSGPRSSTVVVAAAPSALWGRQAATLQRAVSTFVP
jgi:hypothetical protein